MTVRERRKKKPWYLFVGCSGESAGWNDETIGPLFLLCHRLTPSHHLINMLRIEIRDPPHGRDRKLFNPLKANSFNERQEREKCFLFCLTFRWAYDVSAHYFAANQCRNYQPLISDPLYSPLPWTERSVPVFRAERSFCLHHRLLVPVPWYSRLCHVKMDICGNQKKKKNEKKIRAR